MKTTTLFYTGKRYLTHVEDHKFGRFEIEDNGKLVLPEPYANHLLENSPTLFTDIPQIKEIKAPGSDYNKMEWSKLKQYAAERKVREKKKDKIIAELVRQDEEAKKK